jgi:hypothetical protein
MVTRYKYHGYKVYISWLQGIDIMVAWYNYQSWLQGIYIMVTLYKYHGYNI